MQGTLTGQKSAVSVQVAVAATGPGWHNMSRRINWHKTASLAIYRIHAVDWFLLVRTILPGSAADVNPLWPASGCLMASTRVPFAGIHYIGVLWSESSSCWS